LIESALRRLALRGIPIPQAPVLTYPQLTLLVAGAVLVVNQVVLAAAGHVFAASCVDAVVLVGLLNAAAVYEHRTRGRDLIGSRAFGVLALVAAVPVAAAALPYRHISEATGMIVVAVPVAAASVYFASRHEITLRIRFPRTDLRAQAVTVVAAIAATEFGLCAYLLRAPTTNTHGFGTSVLGIAALTSAAVTEEVLFRGVVQASLAQAFGTAGVVFATVLSVALFTTVSWWLIPVICASVSFALVVAVTGALGPAIIAHVAFALSAFVAWPSLLEHWRPDLAVSVPVGFLICGVFLAAVLAATLNEEWWGV
jgi:membrane protease YdiL (CAAX protease family)